MCCTTSAGTPALVGLPKVAQARAGLDQQRVGMAVVAALELDDLVAAGGAARQPQRAHRRLGARADQAHLLDRRHAARGSPRRARSRARSARRTRGRRRRPRCTASSTAGMAVAEDHRPPGADVVDVALAFGVDRSRRRRARAMKRGVPPTARNARTGELTPPGMTRWARSNSSAFVGRLGRASGQWTWRGFFGVVAASLGGLRPRRSARRRPRPRRQRPEEAVGNDVAHARAKAGVERLVEEGERLADGGMQLGAGREQRGQRRRRACRRRRRRWPRSARTSRR